MTSLERRVSDLSGRGPGGKSLMPMLPILCVSENPERANKYGPVSKHALDVRTRLRVLHLVCAHCMR